MIVDSCVHSDRSPALEYLHEIGVNPAAAVTLVVATHWHDDHVRGISDVLAACPDAGFACSAALCRDELVQAIGALPPTRVGKISSGVREMRRVFELLASRASGGQAEWSVQNRLLHDRKGTMHSAVRVVAPSDSVLSDAYRSVARLVDEGSSWRVPRPDRNLGAVVLWVEVGDATMLLGSDLQETPGGHWRAALGCCREFARRSEIFKVPHHGSENGHLTDVWRQILVDHPEAVVCPHQNGDNSLPTPKDLDRLCGLANVHLTAPRAPWPVIQKGRPMRPAVGDCGRVTLRRRLGDGTGWSVDYGGPARGVCSSAE